MTRQEALAKVRTLLGNAGRYRVGRRTSSPERRAAARARKEALIAQIKPLSAQDERARAEARYYNFWVGKRDGFFTSQRAEGDTWEDVIAQLETPRSRAGAPSDAAEPGHEAAG